MSTTEKEVPPKDNKKDTAPEKVEDTARKREQRRRRSLEQ